MTSGEQESTEDIRRDEERAEAAAGLHYGNVAEFVTDRLIYFIPRPVPGSGRVWCAEWYRHAQALSRLDSIWRAWEHLRLDPALGMSNWWIHYADPNIRALMDPVVGPFALCADGHHPDSIQPLPVFEPPEGLFFDQRDSAKPSVDPFSLD
ncbi:DUF4913 domain-containing protein [Kutzneria sp. NPDC052558]|uniref:DUF4913 domain-containing protein n=1 Tax=Kutzneria sp. NPDC052558 TaxID=3364121 RepID=UPI0037C4FBE3